MKPGKTFISTGPSGSLGSGPDQVCKEAMSISSSLGSLYLNPEVSKCN